MQPKIVTDSDGREDWYLNGQPHREDGPAVTGADGYKAWYLHGLIHREGGPAIISADGTERWFLYGKQLTENEHWAIKFKKQIDEAVNAST